MDIELRNQIDQILRSPTSFSPEVFHRIAANYAERVKSINLKVSICNQWLDKGLLSEAVHMASIEPDLLGSLAILDLGNSLDTWDSLCEANGATIAPKANWELASYINEACESENELKPLLKDVRLAMLRHASLGDRIKVLRNLLSENQSNPLWETMVREHEIIIIGDLRNDLNDAISHQKLNKISFIKSELFSADWVEPPPQDLINLATNAKNQTKIKKINIKFLETAEIMRKALGENNEQKVRKYADEWRVAVSIGYQPTEEAIDLAEPVFLWLDSTDNEHKMETKHKLACDALTIALDDSSPTQKLEVLYSKIIRTKLGVPPILERRYKNRVSEFNSSERKKVVVKVVAIVLIIAAVVTITFFINHWNKNQKDFTVFQHNLENAIDNIPPRIVLIEDLLNHGYITYQDEMEGSLKTIVYDAQKIIDGDSEKREKFKKLLASLGGLSPLNVSKEKLSQLNSLATNKEDRKKAETFIDLCSSAKEEADAENKNEIDSDFEVAKNKYTSIKIVFDNASNRGALVADQEKLNNLSEDLDNIFEMEEGLHRPRHAQKLKIRELSGQVIKLLVQIRADIRTQKEASGIEYSLLAATSIDEYITEIKNLKRIEQYQHRDDIRLVYQSVQIIKAVSNWATVRTQIPSDLKLLHDYKTKVNQLSDDLENLVSSEIPNKSNVLVIADYVKSVAKMYYPDNLPKGRLNLFLNGPEGASSVWNKPGLRRLITPAGNYFGDESSGFEVEIKSSASKQETKYQINGCYLNDKDLITHVGRPKVIGSDGLRNVASRKTVSAGLLDWVGVVTKEELLSIPPKNINQGLWYLVLLEKISEIDRMEPLVRLSLTAKIAKLHQDVSWYPYKSLEELAGKHETQPPDGWSDPSALKDPRSAASNILSSLNKKSIQKMKQKFNEALDKLVIPPSHRYAGVIWVDENEKKSVYFDGEKHMMVNNNNSIQLFVLVSFNNNSSWRQIVVSDSVTVPVFLDLERFPLGTAVFVENK